MLTVRRVAKAVSRWRSRGKETREEPPTWEQIFDFVIKYGSISGQPPFSPPTWPNFIWSRLQILVLFLLAFRMIATVAFPSPGFFLGILFLINIGHISFRMFHIYHFIDEYNGYFADVDAFLRDNERNPITDRIHRHFLKIWQRENPGRVVSSLFVLQMGIDFLWCSGTIYNALANEEIPRPVYWSPYFDSSIYLKWFYVVHEIIPASVVIYLTWYLSTLFTSLIKFQYSQLLYAKELLDHIAESGGRKRTRENLSWWIKTHQNVLEMTEKVQKLMGPHALASYFAQMLMAALAIIVLVFENTTQIQSHKILLVMFSVSYSLQFGYDCVVVDRLQDVHSTTMEAMFTDDLMEFDVWQFSAYKMCVARINKAIKITGLNFITINCVTYREFIVSIYSLYTSLVTVLNTKDKSGM